MVKCRGVAYRGVVDLVATVRVRVTVARVVVVWTVVEVLIVVVMVGVVVLDAMVVVAVVVLVVLVLVVVEVVVSAASDVVDSSSDSTNLLGRFFCLSEWVMGEIEVI